MGYCWRAGHSRNSGKRCINYLFPPDAECSAFSLNEELGAGGGWVKWTGGVGERSREKLSDERRAMKWCQ